MRLAFELGLGALLGASVLGAVLVVGVGIARERSYIQKYYLQHGLVQMLEGTMEAAQIIDKPIVDALRDGAVRLIDCAWLLDLLLPCFYPAGYGDTRSTGLLAFYAVNSCTLPCTLHIRVVTPKGPHFFPTPNLCTRVAHRALPHSSL